MAPAPFRYRIFRLIVKGEADVITHNDTRSFLKDNLREHRPGAEGDQVVGRAADADLGDSLRETTEGSHPFGTVVLTEIVLTEMQSVA